MGTDVMDRNDVSSRHLTEFEIRRMFSIGLGPKFEEVNAEHLRRCLDCRMLFAEIRDAATLRPWIADELRRSPMRAAAIRDTMSRSIEERYGRKEVERHPVLNYVSDCAFVRRLSLVEPRVTASLIARVAAATASQQAGNLLVKTGEFNAHVYSLLRDEYSFDQILSQSAHPLNIVIVGGPDISVIREDPQCEAEFWKGNYTLELAHNQDKRATLYFKESEREVYHYVVHSASNVIAFCDDFHEQLCERGTTVVYNDRQFCDHLRKDFYQTIERQGTVRWDRSFDSVANRLKAMGAIYQGGNSEV